jgi:hypothetical protein
MRMKHSLSASLVGYLAVAVAASVSGQQPDESSSPDEGRKVLQLATEHMQQLQMRLAAGGEEVELVDRPLLSYGDAARANKNGTLWAFGKQGRPQALLELYHGMEADAPWVHAVTLTGTDALKLQNPSGVVWSPKSAQIAPAPFSGVANPDAKKTTRLRQMKDLARRFSAHEFWEPKNSRFELRLLVQPVLRYRDAGNKIHDAAVFVLAHGTNPEVILLIEALGANLEESRWHYSLARLGSAEMHVELDGSEVWKQDRTPGVVGQPVDPYWLFFSAARPRD